MRRMQKRPWYKTPLGIGGIAALVIALGLVVFFLLRGSGNKEPVQPQKPSQEQTNPGQQNQPEEKPQEEKKPDPEPEPEPDPEPEEEPKQENTGGYTGQEQVDGVWNLALVNPWNAMQKGYKPELTTLDGISSYSGAEIDSRCYPQLKKMMDDCSDYGDCSPYVCSAYRTWDTQQTLFDRQVAAYGGDEEKAAREVAVPGTSEHQLGLAVDIIDTSNWNLDESQESTPTQQWLMANSWRYGFILRYPNGTTDITGIIYEPWHYRYVGCQVAKEIHEKGVTLEEYLGRAAH